ncbi:MAG: Rrf2 family transcriptional regulator [Phycisphaerae bacterium]|nr:Rrf2 family transcriptional regulator [Phycisphaerae bacterium]
MRLSRKSEYTLLAMLDLAEQYGQSYIKSGDVSQRRKIPKQYLDQLFSILKRAGYIQTARGAAGGYRLSRPPKDIHLAELIRLMDGPLAPVGSVSEFFYESTPIEQNSRLLELFRDIRNQIALRLQQTSLADLI